MSNSIIKYENFSPEKVYYCPCLENRVKLLTSKFVPILK